MLNSLENLTARLLRWAHGRLPMWARRRMDTGDLVQDALLKALISLGELEKIEPARLRCYLQACIRNRISDEMRHAAIGEARNGAQPVVKDPAPGVLDRLMKREDQARFRQALLTLDVRDQELIVGRIELGIPYRELAVATGQASAEAVRSKTRRALLRLAYNLEPRAEAG